MIKKSKIEYPLSLQQIQALSISDYTSDHVRLCVVVKKQISKDELQSALDKITSEHEVLNMGFCLEGAEYIAEIYNEVSHSLNEDPSSKTSNVLMPCDLWKFKCKQDPDFTTIAIHGHPAVTDIHALDYLAKEWLSKVFNLPVNSTDTQYSQYASWRADIQNESDARESIEFWQNFPECTNVRTGLERSINSNFEKREKVVVRMPDSWQEVEKKLEDKGHSLEEYAHCIWAILLFRLCGNDQVAYARGAKGREYEEFVSIQGPFQTYFPSTLTIDGNNVLDTLYKISAISEEANAHLHYLNLPHKCKSAFSFIQLSLNELSLDIALYPIEAEAVHLQSEVSVLMWKANNELHLSISYEHKKWSGQGIDWLFNMYKKLWFEAVSQLEVQIDQLRLLENKFEENLKSKFSKIPKTPYLYSSICSQIFSTDHNDKCVINSINGDSVTYLELHSRSNQLALFLMSNFNIQPGDKVVIMLNDLSEILIALFAIWKSAAVFVPISPSTPKKRLDFMLEDLSPDLVILNSDQMFDLENFEGSLFAIDIQLNDLDSSLDFSPRYNLPEDIAYMIYTSGTTGQPKACMQTHSNISQYIHWASTHYFQQSESANFPYYTDLSFDLSLTSILLPLYRGDKIIIYELGTTIDKLLKYHFSHPDVDCIKMTPSHVRILPSLEIDKTKIGKAIIGGEELTKSDIQILKELNPDIRIFNEYGPTETTVGCLCWEVPDNYNHILIGRPITGCRLYILDKNNEVCPPGITGELCISGWGVGGGYYQRETQTSDRFVPDLLGEGMMYKSGDLARYNSDGEFEFMGRNDLQLKINGYRIEVAEIEFHLRNHDQIKNACVIGWNRKDSSGKELVAYIVCKDSLIPDDLHSFLSVYLPEYMMPSHFHSIEDIPLTKNGKVNYDMLPNPMDIIQSERNYILPSSKSEKLIALSWEEILGVNSVGIHDSFFRFGGDSIKAIQVVAKLRKQGLFLDVKDLLQSPTIKELGEIASWKDSLEESFDFTSGPFPLVPLQIDLLSKSPELAYHFNQSVLIKSSVNLNYKALKKTLDFILERHPSLRLIVERKEYKWMQYVGPMVSAHLELRDLNSSDQRDQEFLNIVKSMQQDFDLSQGNLLRCVMFRSDGMDNLLIVIHHFAIDAISWRILLEELDQVYNHFDSQSPLDLSPELYSYAAFVKSWKNFAQSHEAEKELEHWLEIQNAPISSLKKNRSGQGRKYESMASLNYKLNKSLSQLLLGRVHSAYNTQMNDILLTALGRALYRWQNIKRIVLMLDGHGRNGTFPHPDISSTIGWFTSEYPWLLTIDPDLDIGIQLRNIKDALKNIPRHGQMYDGLRRMGSLKTQKLFKPDFTPEISFNFLGDMDVKESKSIFSISNDPVPGNIHPKMEMPYSLSFTAIILNGKFQIAANYNQLEFQRAQIERVLAYYLDELEFIINHCTSQLDMKMSPGDIDYDGFGVKELDEFLESL